MIFNEFPPRGLNNGAREGFINRKKAKGRYAQPNGEAGKGANKGKASKYRAACSQCPPTMIPIGENGVYVTVAKSAKGAQCKLKHRFRVGAGVIPANESLQLEA